MQINCCRVHGVRGDHEVCAHDFPPCEPFFHDFRVHDHACAHRARVRDHGCVRVLRILLQAPSRAPPHHGWTLLQAPSPHGWTLLITIPIPILLFPFCFPRPSWSVGAHAHAPSSLPSFQTSLHEAWQLALSQAFSLPQQLAFSLPQQLASLSWQAFPQQLWQELKWIQQLGQKLVQPNRQEQAQQQLVQLLVLRCEDERRRRTAQ